MAERLFILPHTLVGLIILFIVVGDPLFILLTPAVPGEVNTISSTHTARGGTKWHVNFAYFPQRPAGPNRLVDNQSITPDEASRLHRGDRLLVHQARFGAVHYATIARTFDDYARDWWFVWAWALVWNSIMLAVLYSAWIVPMRYKRLVREGEPVVGRIMAVNSTGKSGTFHRVKYEFRTAGLSPIRHANEMTVTSKEYDGASAGDSIVVLYDPRRPHRNVAYQLSGFSAELA
ncbi:MAG TPA: DUF3592 domain-containing protein [Tepidisphaeraceae bacterium]|nr:DUF3592 domain-containing protein [Tepidisphaeraceae bacterium]